MQVLCDLRPTFLKCNCQTPVITFFYFFIENFNEIYYETKKERKLNYLTHKKKQATLILVCEIFKGEIIWN